MYGIYASFYGRHFLGRLLYFVMLLVSGKYHSKGVITLLFDFVSDPDPNIRAVAALSLAKTGGTTLQLYV